MQHRRGTVKKFKPCEGSILVTEKGHEGVFLDRVWPDMSRQLGVGFRKPDKHRVRSACNRGKMKMPETWVGNNRPSESPMSPSRIASPARLLGLSPVKAPTMQSGGNPYLVSLSMKNTQN